MLHIAQPKMDQSLCSSLITWLRSFPGHANLSSSSLTDGVALGTILHQIAPEYFTEHWLAKIRTDVGENWRLKVSNLSKIYQGVMDYFYFYETSGQIQTIHQLPKPDFNRIVEKEDDLELGRLLQLILGCAISCEHKQKHIEEIMKMEESVQAVIVNVIQQMMNSGDMLPQQPKEDRPQYEIIRQENKELTERCDELDLQISVLEDENKDLKKRLDEQAEKIPQEPDIERSRYKDLRKQVEDFRDELYKAETTRDEFQNRVAELEKENQDLGSRNEALQSLAGEAQALKDEIDSLRELKERFVVYEGMVETYKKKMEELTDLKRQVKLLEDQNLEYSQINDELEEEKSKSVILRGQCDRYKKRVSDLQWKLDEEVKKTDKQIFENTKLMEKLEAIKQEKERLAVEREDLKEQVEELRVTSQSVQQTAPLPRPDMRSDVNPHLEDRIKRLEEENRNLKENDREFSDLLERNEKLLQENRQFNQRIMKLESDLEDRRNLNQDSDLDAMLREKNEKLAALEESLLKKDSEMAAMDEKYKKYLIKAKAVIRTLDPKHNPTLVPDVSALRNQLTEKEKMIENMEKETEKNKMIRDVEEKLISTAFYNYGMQMHRQMVSQRLSALDQSFLTRQRQGSSRRTMNSNSNVGNSQYYDY